MSKAMPPVHPAADIYPLMSDEEIADLANDIKTRGQFHPILMTGGKILDGRNRWRACDVAGVEPITKEWDCKGDPMEIAESLNGKRRHMTPAQRAAVAAAKAAYYEEQGRERMSEGGRKGKPGEKGRDDSFLPFQDDSKRSVVQAAKSEGAGIVATKALKSIKEKAPEVFTLARDGKVNVEEAKQVAALPAPERKAVVDKITKGGKAPKPTPRTRKPKEEPKPMFERLPEDLPPPPVEAPPEPVSLKKDHTAEPPVPDMWSEMQHDAEETLTGPERDGSAMRHAQQVLRLIGEVRRLVRGR